MRVIKQINLCNIEVDNYSISPQTLDLCMKIKSGEVKIEDLPPIKVHWNGIIFKLTDGRHRITAMKLLGETEIKAKYYE